MLLEFACHLLMLVQPSVSFSDFSQSVSESQSDSVSESASLRVSVRFSLRDRISVRFTGIQGRSECSPQCRLDDAYLHYRKRVVCEGDRLLFHRSGHWAEPGLYSRV